MGGNAAQSKMGSGRRHKGELIREARKERQQEAKGSNRRQKEATPRNRKWEAEDGSHKGKLLREANREK